MADRIDEFKVTPPNLSGTISRPRLIGWVGAVGTPAKWLSAPPGSGKSLLAAQYARATRKRVCWYRLDPRDDDPAFFYARWGSVANSGSRTPRRVALPRVSGEDFADEAAFARRYFTAAIGSGVPASIFVFDDVHELSASERLKALAQFVALLGGKHEILFVGQDAAPREFFDLVASRKIALCNDTALAFDAEECDALAQRLRVSGTSGPKLATITGGHAGALVLACEFLRSTGGRHEGSPEVVSRIHQHMLERLLERMAPARRELLLQTALAPRFDAALAAALAGDDAARELDALVRQGILRYHASTRGDVYEAHGLVRQGARASLSARQGDAALHAHAMKTADLLEAHGHPEDAFELLMEFHAQERAAQVLEPLAAKQARSGEAALLSRAASLLDDSVLLRHPWLCFWVGRALQGIDEERARSWFERSYAGFAAANDASGMRIAAASVVIAFVIEYGDIRTLETWLRRHVEAGGEHPVEQGSAHEATLCMGVICAALNAGAYPATIDANAVTRRLQVLLDDATVWLTCDHAIEAARLLVDNARAFASRQQAQNMVLATRRHIDDADAGALQRGRWCLSAANAYLLDGKLGLAEQYLEQARLLVEQNGSRRLVFELAMHVVDAAQRRGDTTAAEAHLVQIEPIAATAPAAQRAEYARLTARVMLAQHKYVEGLHWADEALSAATLAGYAGAGARAFELERVYGLAANGRTEEAAQLAAVMASRLQGAQFVTMDSLAHCLRFLAGDRRDLDTLRHGLRQAESAGFVYLLARAGSCLPALCEIALAHQLNTSFVQRLIATNNVRPPKNAGPGWPWPVRIRTLGGFDLEIQGESYRPARKAQDKPLELLKLLICCQAMRRESVDKQWLAQRLWPDADEANARKSLDMTLSRLRRLLRDDAAIVASESRLAFSPTHIWTDVAPLLGALSRVSQLRDQRAAGHEVHRAAAAAEVAAVLEHFQGSFLPEDEGPSWLLAGREAIATAVRSTLLIAEALFEGDEDPRFADALERAFNADPTSEDLARALMRSLIRSCQHAEALRIYRRLRDMLSVVLGVAPAHETEQLRLQIHAGANAGIASTTSASN